MLRSTWKFLLRGKHTAWDVWQIFFYFCKCDRCSELTMWHLALWKGYEEIGGLKSTFGTWEIGLGNSNTCNGKQRLAIRFKQSTYQKMTRFHPEFVPTNLVGTVWLNLRHNKNNFRLWSKPQKHIKFFHGTIKKPHTLLKMLRSFLVSNPWSQMPYFFGIRGRRLLCCCWPHGSQSRVWETWNRGQIIWI